MSDLNTADGLREAFKPYNYLFFQSERKKKHYKHTVAIGNRDLKNVRKFSGRTWEEVLKKVQIDFNNHV